MGRGIPTRLGEELILVKLRGTPGRYVVCEEDAGIFQASPFKDSSWGDADLRYFGAQKLCDGDTVNESYRTFSFSEVTDVSRRPSRCVPQGNFEANCLADGQESRPSPMRLDGPGRGW